LELHYIEIATDAPEGQQLLHEFFKEFNAEARQKWVRKILGSHAAVKLDCLAGVYRSDTLPATAHLDPHRQLLNQDTPSGYRATLWSKWVQAAPPPPPPSPQRGPSILLRIQDAQGAGAPFQRDSYPMLIGRAGDIAVAGTYASSRHCTLRWQNGQVELEDHSTNGTWLDGAKLHRQSKPLSLGAHRLKLGKAQGEAKDWPEIELEFRPEMRTPVSEPTPVSLATPIASDTGPLLAVLSAQDATGSPLIDVQSLPFSIGRSKGCDYATPPAHAGVSSHHLLIEALHERGAEVLNEAHDKNGTALEGELQGERFLWPFGATILLAPKWQKDPPVRLLLKRPG
jgi:hypothetical protein